MKKANIVLALFVLLMIPQLLIAVEGILIIEKGYAKVRHLSSEKIYTEIGKKIPVFQGDLIQTGTGTSAKVLIQGKSEDISLFSRSLFKLSLLEKDQTQVKLSFGKARFKVNPAKNKSSFTKRRRFRVRTSTAMIGVKGTEFLVGSSGIGTELLTLSGIVTLASLSNLEAAIEVSKNQISKVLKDQVPTVPVEITEEERKKILQSDFQNSLTEENPFLDQSRLMRPEGSIEGLKGVSIEELERIFDVLKQRQDFEQKNVQIKLNFQ